MSNEFPSDLRQFIGQNIESLAEMEVLLHLHRHAEQAWTAGEIAKSLYIAPEMATVILAELARRGFIIGPGNCYRFNQNHATSSLVDLLAKTYQDRRVAVVTEIYSQSRSKVQTFADSFRLRKED